MAQKRLRPIRDKLFHLGHSVIGSWLDEITKPSDMSQEVFDRKLAAKDIQEIREADCFIIDTAEESTTGGRMVELGTALNQMKLIYHVGKCNCIFLHLADRHFDNWDSLLAYFENEHKVEGYVATGMEDKIFSSEEIDNNGYPPIALLSDKPKLKQYGIEVKLRELPPQWYDDGHGQPRLFATRQDAFHFIVTSQNTQAWEKEGYTYTVKEYTDVV